MLSLETARKLQEAGLKWEPKFGDVYYWSGENWVVDKFDQRRTQILAQDPDPAIFLPQLDQLLAEIEKQEYWWDLNHRMVDVDGKNRHKMWVSKKHRNNTEQRFVLDSPEEAAAQALLWILGQEKGEED